MPTFHITAPTGETYEVDAPEGATQDEALAQVQAAHAGPADIADAHPFGSGKSFDTDQHGNVTGRSGSATAHAAQDQYNPAPTGNPVADAGLNFLAGVGHAPVELGRGIAQDVGALDRNDIAKYRIQDKPLTDTAAGKLGEFGGNALMMLPAAALRLPGAALKGGAALARMAGLGGAYGLAQPSINGTETAANVVGGAALPTALHTVGKGLTYAAQKAYNLMPAGTAARAQDLLNQYIGPGIQEVKDRLGALTGKGTSPATIDGYLPTTAQVGENAGLAQMDRDVRNNPLSSPPMNDRDKYNDFLTATRLEDIAGTDASRAAAREARATVSGSLYRAATEDPANLGVQMPEQGMPNIDDVNAALQKRYQQTRVVNPEDYTGTGLNDLGVRLQRLGAAPAIQDALANAGRMAANKLEPLDQQNLVQQLHYAKMHLDDQISAASDSPTQQRILMGLKHELLGVMDELSPAYKAARLTYQGLSAPVNQGDVGEYMRRKLYSSLNDHGGTGSSPNAFANAVRDGDASARLATKFPGATLEGSVGPQGVHSLNAVADHLGRVQFAQNAGRAVGSPTMQNLVNGNTMAHAADPGSSVLDAIGNHAISHVPLAGPLLNASGKAASARVIRKMGEIALDPHVAYQTLTRQPTRTDLALKYLTNGERGAPSVATSTLSAPATHAVATALAGTPQMQQDGDSAQQ